MKPLLLAFILVQSLVLTAQTESYNWNFGDGASITFLPNGLAPVNVVGSRLKSGRGCASMSDSCTGALLFYTNGDSIWDASHSGMPNGFGLQGSTGSTQSAIIIPKPNASDGQYYVFTIATGKGLSYSVVDMNLNGGLGDVMTSQKNINLINSTQEKVTAVRHKNGKDVWIVTHTFSTDEFYAYHLSNTGIAAPVVTKIGTTYSSNDAVGYMKASPNGSKICMALGGAAKRADLFDFDNASGQVSNFRSSGNYFNIAYGVEFSSIGSKVYISDRTGITQYDLNTVGPGKPLGDSIKFTTSASRAIQLGPDAKIYSNEGWDLGIINNPNLAGTACNYVPASFTLLKFGNSGLPTFLQSYFSPISIQYNNVGSPPSSKLCFGVPTAFNLIIERSIDSVLWDFGDPGSGNFDTSTAFTPQHLYSKIGPFTVTAYVYSSKCGIAQTDTVTEILEVVDLPIPEIDLGKDTSFCPGDTIILVSGGKEPNYLWSTGSTDTLIQVGLPGIYWARGTNACGSIADTIELKHIVSNLRADLGPDSTICSNKQIRLSVAQEKASFLWNTGSTYHTISAKDSGTYWVQVYDICTAVSDTVRVDLKYGPRVDLGNDTIICDDASMLLEATYPNSNYLWQDFSTEPTFEATTEGIYYVRVVNECGTSRDEIYIRTKDCACIVQVPNAFTPNSDQVNDEFAVVTQCDFAEFELSILNRWGQTVFYSSSPDVTWDGNNGQKEIGGGVYTYLIRYKSSNPKDPDVRHLRGTLNVLK